MEPDAASLQMLHRPQQRDSRLIAITAMSETGFLPHGLFYAVF